MTRPLEGAWLGLGLTLLSATAWAMPDTLSVTVTNPNTHAQAVLNLERYNLRSTNFTVRIYTDATSWYGLSPLPEVATYRGRVSGDPRAVVSAYIKPDGKLRAQVVYGNWFEPADPVLGTYPWNVDGVQTAYYPSNTYVYALTTNMPTVVAAGTYPAFTNGFGGPRYVNNMQRFTTRRCNMVIEILNDFYINNCGSSILTALAKAESQMNDADLVTARDYKIAYQLTCVSVRAATQDPYSGLTSGGGLLSKLSSTWSPERSTLPYDKVHCFTSNGYGAGGMAYAPGDYSYTMDSGYYGGVICHEVGHNWWAKDYEATRDYTGTNGYRHAMNGSGLCYCPESVNRALSNVRGKTIESVKYNCPLPPYASPDYATTTKNTARTIDVLLNDFDVNSNALSIVSFSTNTARAGTVALISGQLRYTPPTGFVGTDTFVYRVSDGSGFESGTQVMVLVVDPADALLARWALDETSGLVATESTGRGVNGRLSSGVDFAQDSVPGIDGRALHFNGNGYIEFLNNYDPLDSSFTISVWVRPDATPTGTQYVFKKGYGGDDWGGCNLVLDPARFRFYGNMFGNYSSSAFSAVANVVPQPDTWYHVVAQLDRTNNLARIWVNGVESTATANSRSLANGATGEYVVGNGTLTVGNGFQGAIDDLRVYGKALSSTEITALYSAAGSIPAGAPTPADGERDVPLLPTLSWLPGRSYYQHDLYFGTNLAAVQTASTNAPEFKGRLSASNYTPAVALLPYTQYFWRVDEIQTGTNVAPGALWSFYTAIDTIHGGLRLQLSLDSRDTSGSTTFDRSGPPFSDGTLNGTPPLVSGQVREGMDFNGTSQYVDVPSLNLAVNTLTITTWLKRNGTQSSYCGLVFMRGSTASGLDISTSNQLGYHWNDTAASYNFGSGLVPPDGEWAFAALVVEPTRAVFYLGRTNGVLTSATNNTTHAMSALSSNFRLASDSSSSSRYFKGNLDEVCIWNRALTRAEIGQLLTNGMAGGSVDGPGVDADPATFTWVGTADAYWTNPSNWATNSTPGAGNTILFSDASAANLDTQLGQAFSIAGVQVSGRLRTAGLSSSGPALTVGAGGFNFSNSIAAFMVGAPLTLSANQVWNVSEFATLTARSNISNGGRALTLNADGNVTLNGVLSGGGGLIKNGTGTLTVTAPGQSVTGGTIVNGGTLKALGGGWGSSFFANVSPRTLTINSNATLETTTHSLGGLGGSFYQPTLTLNDGSTWQLDAEQYLGANNLVMKGAAVDIQVNDLRLQGGTLNVNASPVCSSFSGSVTLYGAVTFNVANGTADPDLRVNSPIASSGSQSITKSGTGTMTLSRPCTYTGSTTVTAGILRLVDGDDILPTATSLSISSGATFDANDNNQALAGLSGAGNLSLGTGGLMLNLTSAATFSGSISGTPDASGGGSDTSFVPSGGVAKDGPDRLTLSGVNTYRGDTWLLAGTLALSGTGALSGSSNIIISGGATLDVSARSDGSLNLSAGQTVQGPGIIIGKVAVANGSTVSPGASVGTLPTGAETWYGGGTYRCELNHALNPGGCDLLNISGTLTIQATTGSRFVLKVVSLTSSNTPGLVAGFNNQLAYQWTVATTTGGIVGFQGDAFLIDASEFANDLGGGSFSPTVVGNTLVLRFTPATVPAMGNYGLLANGSFAVSGTGGPNQVYVLLAAGELASPTAWIPIATNQADVNGLFSFADPQSTHYPRRYYRVQLGR